MSKITVAYYQDPGHGWIAVPTKELAELGIADKVSSCSYQHDQTTYLEEDCDLTLYVKAQNAKGNVVAFEEVHTNYDSPIRAFAPYSPPKPKRRAKIIYTEGDLTKVTTEDLMKVLDLWSKLTPVGKVHFRAKYANMDDGLKAISAELTRRTMKPAKPLSEWHWGQH